MSTQAATAAARRSKISPERELELYDAVLDLLREGGYDSVTMEGVAARTKCGKATLYRQWKNKPLLVTAALSASRCSFFSGIDTGTLAGDLREAARAVGRREGPDTALMEAVGQAYIKHPDLREALRETVLNPEIAALDAMLGRAVERGEIAADNPAIGYVAPMVMGMLRVERLFEDRFHGESAVLGLLESVVFPALRIG
ncbi:TetR/AcrR family transcriptional regulator [Streptomyces sp. NBC_00083]|uniref:TetR/AcrR family transcriptional regulator n=1 Tax=Streptomyces sp. NBC_00083 TaxID=2975647 RepID=UPI002256E3D6|nr:TetR/AcrR family transcriptional regulator [Streptomyces sp. NBC_00083]MCX5386817.1 TetR/AcrR family transcriptional regulator [Streptomyces sp. NBC_00083]